MVATVLGGDTRQAVPLSLTNLNTVTYAHVSSYVLPGPSQVINRETDPLAVAFHITEIAPPESTHMSLVDSGSNSLGITGSYQLIHTGRHVSQKPTCLCHRHTTSCMFP